MVEVGKVEEVPAAGRRFSPLPAGPINGIPIKFWLSGGGSLRRGCSRLCGGGHSCSEKEHFTGSRGCELEVALFTRVYLPSPNVIPYEFTRSNIYWTIVDSTYSWLELRFTKLSSVCSCSSGEILPALAVSLMVMTPCHCERNGRKSRSWKYLRYKGASRSSCRIIYQLIILVN